jgi:hypothetical protein
MVDLLDFAMCKNLVKDAIVRAPRLTNQFSRHDTTFDGSDIHLINIPLHFRGSRLSRVLDSEAVPLMRANSPCYCACAFKIFCRISHPVISAFPNASACMGFDMYLDKREATVSLHFEVLLENGDKFKDEMFWIATEHVVVHTKIIVRVDFIPSHPTPQTRAQFFIRSDRLI